MSFRAIISEHTLCLGCRVTFLPDSFDPAGPPPPVPTGIVVPLFLSAGRADPEWSRLNHVGLTIEAATRPEILAVLPTGQRFRLTPRKPSEPGGLWRPNAGMSEWVVRDERA